VFISSIVNGLACNLSQEFLRQPNSDPVFQVFHLLMCV